MFKTLGDLWRRLGSSSPAVPRANPGHARNRGRLEDERNSNTGATPLAGAKPTEDAMQTASSLCDEIEEGRMLAGVRRWSDLLDRRDVGEPDGNSQHPKEIIR